MAKSSKELEVVGKQLWGVAVGFGVVSILFGTLALFWPGLTVALMIAFFGVFVLIWGVVRFITSLATIGSDKFWWLELIFSLLAIGLAVYLLRNPEASATLFVLYIGLTFLFRGVIDIVEGLFDGGRRTEERALSILLGVLGIVAAAITLAHPVAAGVAVVWVIGLYAILYGSLIIGFAFKLKTLTEK